MSEILIGARFLIAMNAGEEILVNVRSVGWFDGDGYLMGFFVWDRDESWDEAMNIP